ncbi:hypothetical protein F5J12DRAFT_850436 [Pisolithus orientalis]|uniref:uncharacterized protein n=1 Tax=Pisolithus orientalis TaxID=936130 RepID=UPI00222408DC|nr:uncharacterized protein F5J12DRAFT_850436 [Pisolithus orientalis]KAI5997800.1 hypothetical protein F5J12DRAFT_850436 [Pisolithus orientalis]
MAKITELSSDDDAPEVVSKSTSRANARRDQKTLQNFTAEQNARKKAQNRERDRKLKEQAQISTKKKIRPATKLQETADGEPSESEGDGRSSPVGGNRDDGHVRDRMLRAMQDAAEEGDSEDSDEELEGGIGEPMSGDSEVEDDPDTAMHLEEESSDTSIADLEEDEEEPIFEEMRSERLDRSSRRPRAQEPQYLSDELFAAAFASQKSNPVSIEAERSTKSEPSSRNRRRKLPEGPKDIILGGRTFRTLTKLSDPKSKATVRTLPSARVRKFADSNLALGGGKTAMLKAKKKGWERRPANVGAMKPDGAPTAFCRGAA